MKSLIIENVRCFAEEVVAPLAPLTLLVGENSTGKSTFLAAVRIASQLARRNFAPDFNEEPFLLGAYEQIANYRRGPAGRARSFKIGFECDVPQKTAKNGSEIAPCQARLLSEFVNKGSQPFLESWSIQAGPHLSVSIRQVGVRGGATLTVHSPAGELTVACSPAFGFPAGFMLDPDFLRLLLDGKISRAAEVAIEGNRPAPADTALLGRLLNHVRSAFRWRLYAGAPIRTEPRRTYELLKDSPRPAGGHVPMILAQIYGRDQWQQMETALQGFGLASGLFETVGVKRLGGRESSPFQIFVKVHGPAFNLVDVGYGVSQVLPVVVDMLQAAKGSMFLLQQPEVHLHPRAQAALGSLLGQLVKSDNKRFVVETHSDYLVDRVRMDVQSQKSLRPQDVVVLYFQQERSGVQIHPMTVDENGNFKEVPPGYRWFFLEEQKRFLGI